MFETNLKSNTITLAFIMLMCICVPHSVIGQDFGYDGKTGPAHWGEQYNTCGGKFQSPININILEVVDRAYHPLVMNGFNVTPITAELVNNGHTVIAKFTYKEDEIPTIHGGSLGSKGIYRFSQFHFHWGNNDTVGSEDRINNISYPAELHMVFYNVKYDSFTEAVTHSGGVSVLAFFYAIQKKENSNYEEFSNLLGKVREPNKKATFGSAPPTLEKLINSDIENYFTYTGSLTTPPCSEDVTWIDFEEPIMISAGQQKILCLSSSGHKRDSIVAYGTVIRTVVANLSDPYNAIPFIYDQKKLCLSSSGHKRDSIAPNGTVIRTVVADYSDAFSVIPFIYDIQPFRHLYTLEGIPLTHNFRPVQPLNNRTVFKAMPRSSPAFQQHMYDGRNGASEIVLKSIFHLFMAYLCTKMCSLCY